MAHFVARGSVDQECATCHATGAATVCGADQVPCVTVDMDLAAQKLSTDPVPDVTVDWSTDVVRRIITEDHVIDCR